MDTDPIADFLAKGPFAVAGASSNRSKYGNKVLRAYLQRGFKAYPVHPYEKTVEGVPVSAKLADLPEPVHGLSVITPAEVTERLVDEAAAVGIRRIWMQPGAESEAAVEKARTLGMSVISGGPCVLVALRFRE
ncbi:MAG TPA: CoA-binding protein [Planctomycetota bacterium]|nr:CoA-binding protein [Planctomycetota bacterium]